MPVSARCCFIQSTSSALVSNPPLTSLTRQNSNPPPPPPFCPLHSLRNCPDRLLVSSTRHLAPIPPSPSRQSADFATLKHSLFPRIVPSKASNPLSPWCCCRIPLLDLLLPLLPSVAYSSNTTWSTFCPRRNDRQCPFLTILLHVYSSRNPQLASPRLETACQAGLSFSFTFVIRRVRSYCVSRQVPRILFSTCSPISELQTLLTLFQFLGQASTDSTTCDDLTAASQTHNLDSRAL